MDDNKAFPQGTTTLYQHLGVHEHAGHDEQHGDHNNDQAPDIRTDAHSTDAHSDEHSNSPALVEHDIETNTYTFNIVSVLKNAWPYAAVFIIALAGFYIFFTNLSIKNSLQSMFASKPAATSSTATAAVKVPANQQAAYNAWINSYFFAVSDPSVLDPNKDLSGNGLTNYQKFLLGLNPLKKSTLGLNISDTQALLEGIDPLTGQPMTDAEKNYVNQNIDLEALSNQMTILSMQRTPQVAGASFIPTAQAAQVPGVTGYDRSQNVQIDITKNAVINIPSLKISAPLIWAQNISQIDADLPNGLVHYPGTPMPGDIGTSYISGHSSNYAWVKGQYNNVLSNLGNLKTYDSFSVTATTSAGKQITFHYVVTAAQIYSANDQAQFANTGKSSMALSTCWPVGTNSKRLVVFGTLTQVDQ